MKFLSFNVKTFIVTHTKVIDVCDTEVRISAIILNAFTSQVASKIARIGPAGWQTEPIAMHRAGTAIFRQGPEDATRVSGRIVVRIGRSEEVIPDVIDLRKRDTATSIGNSEQRR